MSPSLLERERALEADVSLELEALGALTAISRSGGQGRVFVPARPPAGLGSQTVVKLYRARPPQDAAAALARMVRFSRELAPAQREQLHGLAAWPLATVASAGTLRGILMRDVRERFQAPFLMPSGRTARVLLALEHLLGADEYLQQRGLPILLDGYTRAAVAERVCAAFAFLHRHAIVVGDVSPSNLLVRFAAAPREERGLRGQGGLHGQDGPPGGAGLRGRHRPEVLLIDCDSMVLHGRPALATVQTGDWQLPAAFAPESPLTRAADAYKLGLVVLRLFARSHDARSLAPHAALVPAQLRPLLARALAADAPNRPTAGEWRLALRRALADGELARLDPLPRLVPRPGPAPARRPAFERPAQAAGGGGGRGFARAPLAAQPAPVPAVGARQRSLMPAFAIGWLLLGALLLVLFAHLLAGAAAISPGGPRAAGEGLSGLTPGGGYAYRSPEGAYGSRGEEGEERAGALEPRRGEASEGAGEAR